MTAERMASREAASGQPRAPKRAVHFDRLDGIFRTGGNETTGTGAGKEGAAGQLICPEHPQREPCSPVVPLSIDIHLDSSSADGRLSAAFSMRRSRFA